jgi:predicted ABC-type sugar transport system permease subunit
MMQEWIVGLIVVVAAWTVAKRYAPGAVRSAIRAGAAAVARRAGLSGWADRLQSTPAASSSCGDGCGSCGGCSSETSSAAKNGSLHNTISVDQLRRTIPR